MIFEHLEGQAEPFLAEDEPILPAVSGEGTQFSDLFPGSEEEELWRKAAETTQETLTYLFGERWYAVYIFRDGQSDQFFYQSISQYGKGVNIPVERVWERIKQGYNLPQDYNMGRYMFIRNRNHNEGS